MNSLQAHPDQVLINLYKNGDEPAMSQLITRYRQKMITTITLLVKDSFLADDIYQETCIRIVHTIKDGRYNEEGKFYPWAIRIARNLCLDHFRKQKRSPQVSNGTDKDIFELINLSEPGADKMMERRDEINEIICLLDRLPAEQRDVIILRHFADLSFKQISAVTGASINTCLGRMRYGLLNLRKMAVKKGSSLAA